MIQLLTFRRPYRRPALLVRFIIILFIVLLTIPMLRPTQAASTITVQIKNNGAETNQETPFTFQVTNTGMSAVSGLSVRIYFTLDGSNAASNYTLEKYYDQSGVATITGPTLASGSTYYDTISYGTASLAAGAVWQFQTALHLANWGTTYDGTNDWYHTGYAFNALPAALTNTNYIPGYISGTLVWGSAPGGSPVPTTTVTTAPTVIMTSTSTRTSTFVPPTATTARTNTPANTGTAVSTSTRTNTPISTSTRTSTPLSTSTRTNTPVVTATPTLAPTTAVPTTAVPTTPSATGVTVQIKATGTDSTSQTQFAYQINNTGTTARSNLSARIYFTIDGSNAASSYVLDKNYDQSGVATVSGPTLENGITYYFTISYGTASLAAGASWQFQTALHLSSWANSVSSANDWYHTGYAVGALPSALTNTNYIPAYVNGSLVWGIEAPSVTAVPTITPSPSPTTGPTPVGSNTLYLGNATWFQGLGSPYGGCGITQSALDSQNFLALNVQNTPGDYTTFLSRPISSQYASEIGEFNNGLNCGRWVKVTIGNYCTGNNDGAPNQPFCHGGSWIPDQYNGATLDMLVADSCQDGNAWCRDDSYHVDLAQAAVQGQFMLNGQPVTTMYSCCWGNRQVYWQFEPAPNYTGDINIGFIQDSKLTWTPIAITHLQNGIHGVDYFQNGTWIASTMDADMGQDYFIGPTITGGSSYQIRVHDVNNQLINNGRNYLFSYPSSCGTACGPAFTQVTYTTQ